MDPPEALREYFTLAPISAKDLGILGVNGERVSPSQVLSPRLEVIPIGWSHAVDCRQQVVKDVVLSVPEISQSMFVEDGKPVPDITKGAIVIYVDNVIVQCTDPERCEYLQIKVNAALIARGLTVHEMSFSEDATQVIGW